MSNFNIKNDIAKESNQCADFILNKPFKIVQNEKLNPPTNKKEDFLVNLSAHFVAIVIILFILFFFIFLIPLLTSKFKER